MLSLPTSTAHPPATPTQIYHSVGPKLLRQPITTAHLRALGELAEVAGELDCCDGLDNG